MELSVDITKKFSGFTLKAAFNTSGDVLGLLGSSGSGKSMTLRCIAGLETPDNGRIVLNGKVLFDSEKRINLSCQKRKVGFLFQNYALFPHMTVKQNIGFALDGLSNAERVRRVREKIRMMGLEGLEDRYPSQLSGGQQQRAALARAVAIEPDLLLLDEPFSALDNHLRGRMEEELMNTLSNYNGITVFVSHDIEEVYKLCKSLVILSEGSISAAGSREMIFDNPPTLQAEQLTGCKNLSGVRAAGHGTVYAADWGCELHIDRPIRPNSAFIGIRAQHISISENEEERNVLRCSIANISENIYTVTVFLKVMDSKCEKSSYDLQWDVPKERWDSVKGRALPWNIRLAPERLFLTE